MLPGLDGTGDLFGPLLPHLPASICPVIVRYPADRTAGIDELAGIVADVARAHDRPIALAESFSGPILLRVLALDPGRFRGVIFCASFATCPRPFLLGAAAAAPLRWLFRWRLPDSLIRALCLDAGSPDSLVSQVQDIVLRVRPDVLGERVRLIAALQEPIPPALSIPCLYLQATRDRLVPAGCATWFQARFEHAQVVRIDGPHLLLQARPGEAAAAIERFCGDLGEKAPRLALPGREDE